MGHMKSRIINLLYEIIITQSPQLVFLYPGLFCACSLLHDLIVLTFNSSTQESVNSSHIRQKQIVVVWFTDCVWESLCSAYVVLIWSTVPVWSMSEQRAFHLSVMAPHSIKKFFNLLFESPPPRLFILLTKQRGTPQFPLQQFYIQIRGTLVQLSPSLFLNNFCFPCVFLFRYVSSLLSMSL